MLHEFAVRSDAGTLQVSRALVKMSIQEGALLHLISMRKFAPGILCVLLVWAASVVDAQPSHVIALPAGSSYGEKLTVAGIHNFGKVSDQLYRGAQPDDAGVKQLKKIGITTIIDLRREDPSERDREKHAAEGVGIQFVSIPVSGWSAPADAQVVKFLSIFADPKQKVFVHCHFGEDRTGVFVAAYRMAMQQWSAEQAIQEMRLFGFHAFWHPTMTAFTRQFPSALSSSAFAATRDPKPLIPARVIPATMAQATP